MDTKTVRRFLVTGVSSGLGRALAEAALERGHVVVGTVRRAQDGEAFEALAPGRALARQVDVTDDAAVFAMVDEVEAAVGPIDVVVACAGYGHEGTVEESSMDELRRQFDVNVYGVVATVKAALPRMRARRAGHLIAISSMAGFITMPGLAFYHASKYAVEGFMESLSKEVGPLGVRVTVVAPGSFRTDWAGRSMVRTPLEIPDYEGVFGPLRAARLEADGNQLGNPAAGAAAVLEIVDAPEPPVHLVLGSDALRLISNGRAAVDAEIEAWEALSRSTDFAEGAQIA